MTPSEFIAQWGPGGTSAHLNEEQGAQSHFLDLCELLEVPKPGSPNVADEYVFERRSKVLGEARGYADVFYRDHFAWENKAPGKNLDAALRQLQQYSLALANPPLLVVCDRLTIRIHTQFNGHPSETHTVRIDQLDQPAPRALLRRLWLDPASFRPRATNRDITEAAARSFATLAEQLRQRGHGADPVAHFLTQCLFCFFAEDVGLLPSRMFERLVNNRQITSERLTQGMKTLFETMREGGLYGADDIPWFNGGLFQKVEVPKLEIIDITELRNAAGLNWSAIDVSIFGTLFERGLDPAKRSQLGAHYTDPATIERIIDPVLRRPLLQEWAQVAQAIRAHMAKSKRKNDKAHQTAQRHFVGWLERLTAYRALDPACGSGNFLYLALKALKDVEHQTHLEAADWGLDRETDLVTGPHNVLGIELNEYAAELARVTVWIGELQWRLAHGYPFKMNPVLDSLEHIECRDALLTFGVFSGAGIGASGVGALGEGAGQEGQGPGAHEPAAPKSPQTPAPPTPPGEFERPALGAAQTAGPKPSAAQAWGSDHDFAQQNSCSDPHPGPPGTAPRMATWPAAEVVIGNPPFLGGSKKRGELGARYADALDTVFAPHVPGSADLVCYWFHQSLRAMEAGRLTAAGLVSTNSIRGGNNRKVLDAITERSRIFNAWSDEPWVNNGAAVRVSLIAFGTTAAPDSQLDGQAVPQIYADLTAPTEAGDSLNLSKAQPLPANLGASFQGASKKAKFEIPADLARQWLTLPNPHGRPNSDVLKPWANGFELSRGPQHQWIIDFGIQMPEADAAFYEVPFAYVEQHVKPERLKNNRETYRKFWWRFAEARPGLRRALESLPRFIATVAHSKHRFFVWLPVTTSPDQALITVTRADDTTLGILHSRMHELWSLRMGTSIGVGNDPRYTPTTCFETFPFPAGLTPADTAHQRTEALDNGARIPADLPEGAPGSPSATKAAATAIAQAAHRLDALRQNWLNPPEWTERVPEVIPLGMDHSPYPDRIVAKPGFEKELAKRTLTNLYNQRPAWLTAAHQALDAAVATAYGWTDYTPDLPDETLLQRLLALNLERAGKGRKA